MEEKREKTFSICPVCGSRVPALRIHRPDGSWMEKICPEHGSFRTLLWRGRRSWREWVGDRPALKEEECRNCGSCRGLCSEHKRNTCCTLLEVTGRCNLRCSFCFAGDRGEGDPSSEQVKAWIFDLTVPGETLLQLSGGEPTLRDDLPELVSFAKKCGCRYVQLNTNGLRLAEDEEYVRALAEAGLSFVFLQFDGVTEAVYEALRGQPLLAGKERAIRNCGKYGIGVILVPMIVPGINEDQVGAIIRYGAARSPAVRGVHFQPVSYFGRIPHLPGDAERYTLDQLLEAVVEQTDGQVPPEALRPSCCDHPLCGFHGDFAVLRDHSLISLAGRRPERGFGEVTGRKQDPSDRNREFIGRRWQREERGKLPGEGKAFVEEIRQKEEEPEDMTDLDTFLTCVRTYGFTLTAMAFQDAGNVDFERLRNCSLHVYRRGRWIPFCGAYLSYWNSKEKKDESLYDTGRVSRSRKDHFDDGLCPSPDRTGNLPRHCGE